MTYNRIKRDWNQKSLNTSVDITKSINKIQKSPKVSTSLNMGKTFDKTPLYTKITGKTANERLYNSAKLINAKKEFNQRKAAEDIERELEASKYKIKNVSRMLAENKQFHDDTFSDIGHRLYDEGISEKVKREKLYADKEDRRPLEEWSCAKCGSFHKLPTSNVFQQNINLECPNCKWLQSAAIPHQPANIAIEMGTIDPTDVLRKRWQGNTNGNIDLHEYLFANKQLQASKINNLRSQWAEIDSRLPFKPVIPESSEQILKQKMEEKVELALKLKKSLKNCRPSDKNLEHGEYFQMPVAERLFRYKLKSKEPTPRKKIVISGFYEQEMHDAPKRSTSELDMLTSRLTYEYKEIESRRQQAIVEVYTTDPKTKQPLFKPVVIPPPSEKGVSVTNSTDLQESRKRDIFTELLEQSDIKIRNRLLEQQRFYQEQDEKIAKERATALPQSEQILRDATDRSIEEMYRLLIATSTIEINNNDSTVDKAELICKMSTDIQNWELQVLDLNKVNLDVMIPEIKTLVTEVRKEKLKKFEKLSNNSVVASASSSSPLIVDFKEFSTLVRICLKKRNGPGRTYVYAPKKKPQVTLELIQSELQEETYQPVIDKVSAAIAKDRYLKKDITGAAQPRSIEEVLIKEGKKVQEKVEIARKQKEEQEIQGLKFKPKMFKAPKNVVPRYRGLPVYEIDKTSSTNKIVEEKKTVRGGKKPTTSTSPRKPSTPKLNNLTTSEKLISVVWNSLSGHQESVNENENKVDINVPPPQISTNPPHPENLDKVTNRKTKGLKKTEE